MTLQKQDIVVLEEMIERIVRKVIREEYDKKNTTEELKVSDADKELAKQVLNEYKDVFDALA